MPNILIPNKSHHDFSPAERFGDLIYLSEGIINLLSIGKMTRTFEPYIETSSPDDYILASGPSIMTSILCAMFAAKHQQLNLLIYQIDKDNNGYYKHRHVNLKR